MTEEGSRTTSQTRPLFGILKLHNLRLQLGLVFIAYILQGIYYIRFSRPFEIYVTSLGIGIPYLLLILLLSYTVKYTIREVYNFFGQTVVENEINLTENDPGSNGSMELLFQDRDAYKNYQTEVVSRIFTNWKQWNGLVLVIAPALVIAIFGGQFSGGYDVTSGDLPYEITLSEYILDPIFLIRNVFWIVWSYYLTIATFTFVIFLLKIVFLAFNLKEDQGLMTSVEKDYPEDISEFVELEYREFVNRRSIQNFRTDARMITQFMLKVSLLGLIMNILLAITIIVFILLTNISDSLFGLALSVYFPSYLIIILVLFFFPQYRLKNVLEHAKNRHLGALKLAYTRNFSAFIQFDSIEDKAKYLEMYKKINDMITKTNDLDIWPTTIRQWITLLGVAIGPIKPIFDFVDFVELWAFIQEFLM